MKKVKTKSCQPPSKPVTNHPAGVMKPGSIYEPFSLVDYPEPRFLHPPLFHDDNIEELRKDLAQIEIREQQNNHHINTDALREQIRLLELLKMPKDGLDFVRWEFEQADAYQAELIYLLALEGNEKAFQAFGDKTYGYFWRLKHLAKEGHDGALRALATIAIEATEVINKWAAKDPGIFEPIATERVYWPFLISRKNRLNPISDEDEDMMLRQLNLGKSTQQDLSPASRYDPHNQATKVAISLLNYVRDISELAKFMARRNRVDMTKSVVETTDLFLLAGRLPAVAEAPQAAEAWWGVARRFLLESYPALDPSCTTDLNTIAPALLELSQVSGSTARRKGILKNLRRAFLATIVESRPARPETSAQTMERVKRVNPDLYRRLSISSSLGG